MGPSILILLRQGGADINHVSMYVRFGSVEVQEQPDFRRPEFTWAV